MRGGGFRWEMVVQVRGGGGGAKCKRWDGGVNEQRCKRKGERLTESFCKLS